MKTILFCAVGRYAVGLALLAAIAPLAYRSLPPDSLPTDSLPTEQSQNQNQDQNQTVMTIVERTGKQDRRETSSGVQYLTQHSVQQNSVQQNSVQQSSSIQSSSTAQQQTVLNLHSANLSQPYILSVSSSGQLSGQMTLDGKVIQTLGGDASFSSRRYANAQASQRTSINLSPYLTAGQHTVEISAHYSPASSTVQVEFSGVGTQVSQQTSGTGVLDYLLVIQVD